MSNEQKKYKTPQAFEQALISHLKNISEAENKSISSLRYKVVFERFLARIFQNKNDNWVLKGGYSLELRYKGSGISRTTTDIDFVIKELKDLDEEKIWDMLKEMSKINLTDWFSFEVQAPKKELTFPVYGGWRFLVISKIGTKEFNRFNIDVVIGDKFISEVEWVKGNELLSFAGIKAPLIAIIQLEKQFAEKLHTYTNPSLINNSRIRDLVDLIIYLDKGIPDKNMLKKEIEITFKIRNTHDIPKVLLSPPIEWESGYKNLAGDWGASKRTIGEAFEYLNDFWKRLYK